LAIDERLPMIGKEAPASVTGARDDPQAALEELALIADGTTAS
jgi:hypothetical protein